MNNLRRTMMAVLVFTISLPSISLGQGKAPTVAPGDTATSLRVSFVETLYAYDENAYQFQLRRKAPQGDWITDCVDISYRGSAGSVQIYTYFQSLEPGVTYEARYRDTNLSECTDPPSPEPWSRLGEGTTLTENPPVAAFVDATLALVVRRTLGLDLGNGVDVHKIRIVDLSKLKSLSASRMLEITDLSGLEHATQLMTLNLRGHGVTDLTPLEKLTKLTSLDLWGNRVVDIGPLRELKQLRDLDLGGARTGNEIVDVSPLAGLTELRELGLSGNDLSDIGPIAELRELRELRLASNRISDIGPLAQLVHLTELGLDRNEVGDIGPLAELTNLTLLSLTTNQIGDIGALAQLRKLTFLQLGYNQIRDVTALAKMESLATLSLDHNRIRDISPLATLTGLSTLRLSDNQISDVSSLARLSEFALEKLDLRDNRIRDVTALASFTYLEELSLRDNPIANTFPLGALLNQNPDLRIDVEVIREEGGPTLSASTPQRLTAATLNGSVVTLRLSSGAFGLRSAIRDALTISGIGGVTFHWSDIERVRPGEIAITLTFTGSIDRDSKLVLSLGSGAIKNYRGPALTAEIPVSAKLPVTEGLIASTAVPLTAVNLHGSVVTLTLGGNKYDTNWNFVSGNVMVAGIDGVTFRRHNVKRANDVQVTIQLEFGGHVDTDSSLLFTVGAKAIAGYGGPALTAELPVR